MARVAEVFSSLPLVTCGLTLVNITIHGVVFLTSFPTGLVSINPSRIIFHSEVQLTLDCSA
jgi:hypothetical protein